MYCLFCVVLCFVCVYMCTVLLPPGGYPIAVNKYIIIFWVCICSLMCSTCNAHAPYCHLWLYNISPTLYHKLTIS